MIQLKGRQAGALVCVVSDNVDEEEMFSDFDSIMESGAKFLEGRNVVIDMQNRSFSPLLAARIWEYFIKPTGCVVTGWKAEDENSRIAMANAGFKIEDENTEPTSALRVEKSNTSSCAKGLLYAGTIRSGQKLSHDGDIIVSGHVNMGGEVCSGGNIVILGKLKGIVHAGADGDNEASLCVRSLESVQVRIGTKMGIIEKDSDYFGNSVTVTVVDDAIAVAYWPSM